MSEDERFDAESLKKSVQQVGRLYPRLVNQDGKVLDGNHRAEADKDWETKIVQTENRFKELLVRAHAHHRRRVPQEETRALIEEMAESLEKDGIARTEVAVKLVESLPYSESYTRSLIPDIYKNPLQAQIGQRGGEKTATISEPYKGKTAVPTLEQTVKIQDIVSCDRCHVSTSTPVEWHNHQLCEQCHNKALANPDSFNSYFNYQKAQPKTVLTTDRPRPLEKWEDRKAHMSPQHSKMEGIVIASLIESGVTGIIQDRHFCVQETIPDIYLPAQNLAIYLDGEVHNGKQDRDEQLRELLKKRHGVNYLSYSYDSTSQKEVERVTKEILAIVKTEAS